MRSSERAAERIRFGSVAALTRAECGSNHVRLQIDRADDVALGIGDVERVAPPRQSFGACELRQTRLTAVARVPLLAGSGDVMPGHLLAVETVDGVPFPQRQIQVAGRIERNRPRAVERRAFEGGAIRCRLPVAGAAERIDDARRGIDAPTAMVADVADEQGAAARIDRDAVRLPQLRAGCRPAIAREARDASCLQWRD